MTSALTASFNKLAGNAKAMAGVISAVAMDKAAPVSMMMRAVKDAAIERVVDIAQRKVIKPVLRSMDATISPKGPSVPTT